MYKDKDKQREANRQAQARFKAKGITKGITIEGITCAPQVIPEGINQDLSNRASPKQGKDIKCFEDLPLDVQQTINKMSTVDGKIDQTIKRRRTAFAINHQHLIPDSYEPFDAVCTGIVTGKPGDDDYNGICTEEWRAERGR